MKFNGKRLKELRQAKKWDQHRLAEAARAHAVGITQGSISRYENETNEPSSRNAFALAAALDVNIAELYRTEDVKEDAPSGDQFRNGDRADVRGGDLKSGGESLHESTGDAPGGAGVKDAA